MGVVDNMGTGLFILRLVWVLHSDWLSAFDPSQFFLLSRGGVGFVGSLASAVACLPAFQSARPVLLEQAGSRLVVVCRSA
jgi:hypothetical protein